MTNPMIQEGPEEQWVECAECGSLIPEGAPSFAFGPDPGEVLCFECAVRRGGKYDALEDHWTTLPDTSDLEGAPE